MHADENPNNAAEMATVAVTFSLVVLVSCGSIDAGPAAQPERKPNDWLLGAASDEQRFKLLQGQMRGFDQPMWEVGERYERLHEALARGNGELAAYHWEKIRTTIENGIAKRPARAANARQLFLDNGWEETGKALASEDPAISWAAFDRAKAACQACHTAERVEYMNDQPVFDLSGPTAAAR